MKRVICLALLFLMLFSIVSCGNKEDNMETETEKQTESETTMTVGIYEADIFEITTDYCILKYPNEWKEQVTVDVVGDVVSFTHTATGVRVFDIAFGEGEGYVLGVIKDQNGETAVRIVDYDLDQSSAEFQTYCAIAEDVNVIINHLVTDYNFELSN